MAFSPQELAALNRYFISGQRTPLGDLIQRELDALGGGGGGGGSQLLPKQTTGFGSGDSETLVMLTKNVVINSIRIATAVSVAVDDVNFQTIEVRVGATVIGTIDTTSSGTGDFTAFVAKDIAIVGGQANRVAGEVITFRTILTGDGMSVPSFQGVSVQLELTDA